MVVLGLDGLPLSLARTLAATGDFPALAMLTSQARAIRAELPELSPVNWTSFYTATGPEEHGVFGFTRIHAQTYAMGLCDFSQPRVPTIFDRLREVGATARVINLPNTYPARPIPGMLISGFVAPELSRAVFPPMLAGRLEAEGYLLEADTARAVEDPAYLLAQLRITLASRRMALSMLWPDLAWNLFVLVLTETDRLFHFLFHAVEDAAHPLHGECLSLLREWDAVIGDVLALYAQLPGPKRLMVLADHGFTRLITEVDVNACLRDMGLLHTVLPPEACDDLDATGITPATQAFALDPGRIYLHTRARFARGGVSREDVPALQARIREALLSLRYEGQPVMAAVHTGAECYPGPLVAYAPDLVCESNPGFDLKAKFNRRARFGTFGRTGTHTVGDTFFYDSAEGAAEEQLPSVCRVRDAGVRILAQFGLTVRPDRPEFSDHHS